LSRKTDTARAYIRQLANGDDGWQQCNDDVSDNGQEDLIRKLLFWEFIKMKLISKQTK